MTPNRYIFRFQVVKRRVPAQYPRQYFFTIDNIVMNTTPRILSWKLNEKSASGNKLCLISRWYDSLLRIREPSMWDQLWYQSRTRIMSDIFTIGKQFRIQDSHLRRTWRSNPRSTWLLRASRHRWRKDLRSAAWTVRERKDAIPRWHGHKQWPDAWTGKQHTKHWLFLRRFQFFSGEPGGKRWVMGSKDFYSVAAICSVDATTNMHRKKTEHKPRNTLSWLWFSKKQNIVSPPQAPKKYDFRPFQLLFAFQNLKKSACGATKNLEKLHYIELLWLHCRIEIWQPPLTQVRPNIFTSACALTV